MAFMSDDHRVQTDFLFALRVFADTREKEQNWQGFCLYCMEIAATTLRVYQAETGKSPKGLSPVELAKMDKVQSALTMRKIQDAARGAYSAPEITELVANLKGKNASGTFAAENTKLKQDKANLETQLRDSQARVAQARRDLDADLAAVKAACADNAAKAGGCAAQAADCLKILEEMKAASLKSLVETQTILKDIESKTTDPANSAAVHDLVTVVSGRLGSTDVAAVSANVAVITELQEKVKKLNEEKNAWTAEKARLEAELAGARAGSITVSQDSIDLLQKMGKYLDSSFQNANFMPSVESIEKLKGDFTGTSVQFGVELVKLLKGVRNYGMLMGGLSIITNQGFIEKFENVATFFETQNLPLKLIQQFYKLFALEKKDDGLKIIQDLKESNIDSSRKRLVLSKIGNDLQSLDIKKNTRTEGNLKSITNILNSDNDITILQLKMISKHLLLMCFSLLDTVKYKHVSKILSICSKKMMEFRALETDEFDTLMHLVPKIQFMFQKDDLLEKIPVNLFSSGIYMYGSTDVALNSLKENMLQCIESATKDKMDAYDIS